MDTLRPQREADARLEQLEADMEAVMTELGRLRTILEAIGSVAGTAQPRPTDEDDEEAEGNAPSIVVGAATSAITTEQQLRDLVRFVVVQLVLNLYGDDAAKVVVQATQPKRDGAELGLEARHVDERLDALEERYRQLEKANRQLLDLLAFIGGVLGERAARVLEESSAARS